MKKIFYIAIFVPAIAYAQAINHQRIGVDTLRANNRTNKLITIQDTTNFLVRIDTSDTWYPKLGDTTITGAPSITGITKGFQWNLPFPRMKAISWITGLQDSLNNRFRRGDTSWLHATGSYTGFLSNIDWTTFNNKQNALSFPLDTSLTQAKVRKLVAGFGISLSPTSGLGDVTVTADTSAAGGGITTLNGLNPVTQVFAIDSANANWGINSSGSTHTFRFPGAIISGSIAARFKYTDTTAFRAQFLKNADSTSQRTYTNNQLALKLNITDTTSMLSSYLRTSLLALDTTISPASWSSSTLRLPFQRMAWTDKANTFTLQNSFAKGIKTDSIVGYTSDVPIKIKTGRGAKIVIAASNSSSASKNQADYICTGTGDQVTIKQAIATIDSLGGKIFLTEGTFNISDTIIINKDRVTLEGEGWGFWKAFFGGATTDSVQQEGRGVTKLRATSGTFPIIFIANADTTIEEFTYNRRRGIVIRNIYFFGYDRTNDGIQNTGVYVNGGRDHIDQCKFENLFFQNVHYGINIQQDANYINGCTVMKSYGGFIVSGFSASITDNVFADLNYAGIIVRASSSRVVNNLIARTGHYGIILDSLNETAKNSLISSNSFDGSINTGLGIDSIYIDVRSSYCNVVGNIFTSNSSGAYGIKISGKTKLGNTIISSNQFNQTGANTKPFLVNDDSSTVSIIGNSISGSWGTFVKGNGVTLHNNVGQILPDSYLSIDSLALGGATLDSAFTTALNQGGHLGGGLKVDANASIGGTLTTTGAINGNTTLGTSASPTFAGLNLTGLLVETKSSFPSWELNQNGGTTARWQGEILSDGRFSLNEVGVENWITVAKTTGLMTLNGALSMGTHAITAGTAQLTTVRGSDTVKAGTQNGATYSYIIPGGALVQSSDESLKDNIRPFTVNLANFKNVSPRRYNFKEQNFYQTFDEKSVPDSVDVKIDSVRTKRVSNKKVKDAARSKFLADNLSDAKNRSKIEYTNFLANEFNPLMLGKESKELNSGEVMSVMWLKIQQLEKSQDSLKTIVATLKKT